MGRSSGEARRRRDRNINPELERLRGVAVLLVMLAHSPMANAVPVWFNGKSGVDLFFVVSGFVVFSSLHRKLKTGSAGIRDFYIRRFFRIVPLAALGALLALAGAAFFNQQKVWSPVPVVANEIFEIFTLRYNYGVALGSGSDLIHYWSLNVEEHFYLIFPLFLVLVRRFSLRVACLVATILVTLLVTRTPYGAALFYSWGFDPTATIVYSSHCRFDGLALGALLGICHAEGRWPTVDGDRMTDLVARLASWAALAVFVGIGVEYYQQLGIAITTAAAGALVSLAAFRREYVLPLGKLSGVLEYVGARSYSLYILHRILWRFFTTGLQLRLQENNRPIPGLSPTAVAVFIVCTFVAAELSYRLLERPCVAWGRRLTREA